MRAGGAGGGFGFKTVTVIRNITIAPAPATAARSGMFIFEPAEAPEAEGLVEEAAAGAVVTGAEG
jgi:hypothetical protein